MKELKGVSQTLLVPLACRAVESIRSDAILHDPRAVEVCNALGWLFRFSNENECGGYICDRDAHPSI